MIKFDKLVRDRIPEIIKAHGQRCTVRVLGDKEYAQRLDEKLAEELAEYQESGAIEELVDLVQIVYSITEHRGMTWDAFERMRLRKHKERGGFEERILLETVMSPPDTA